MGKSSPSAPAAPDPVATSQAQTASNKETAIANATLNRVNQYTPYGSQTYTKTGDDNGVPIYRSDINLSSLGQDIFNQQQQQDKQINGIATGYLDRIQNTLGQNLDTSGMPKLNSSAGSLDFSGSPQLPGVNDFSADRQRVTNDIYSRMNPELDRQQAQLDAKLANQGILQGSEAYNTEQNNFGQQRNDALTQADLAGGAEQSRLFGLGLQARQQDVGEKSAQGNFNLQNAQFGNTARAQSLQEALTQRQLPLNEFNALRSSSQIQTPQFQGMSPVNMGGTDVAGNIYKSFGGQQDAYNQQVASNNATKSGLYSLGGSLGAAALLSDRRLKRNIRKIGKTPGGINVYEFKYLDSDEQQTGVMAQEVEKVNPMAVITNDNGYKMVNYAMVR